MANRTYLISTNSDQKPAEDGTAKVLSAASYMIPVYWFMLFDTTSFRETDVSTEDGDRMKYTFLSSSTAPAIARAKERLEKVVDAIGENQISLFNKWIEYVTVESLDFLHVETFEQWAMFDDSASFDRHLGMCLGAFSDFEPVNQSANWQELLGQANAWDGQQVSPAGPFSFCGYSWDRKVPWEE